MADANLTPEAEAHALLIRATAGDKSIVVPAVDDPAISAFAVELQKLRLQVTLVRSPSWAKGIKLRKKYAEISPALEEVIAGLREETAEALDQCSTANIDPMTWTGVNTVLAADEHRVTISKWWGAVAGAAIGRAVLGVRRGRLAGRVTTEVGVAASYARR